MGQAAIDRAARRAKRRRVLGQSECCAHCGWRDPVALTKGDDEILCYECRCIADGRATVEDHHLLGRANDPMTVPVPGNVHRGLSDALADWPAEVRHNPDRDPLIWLAQLCRGSGDVMALGAKLLIRAALWLVGLAQALRREHGETWWAELGLPSFWEAVAG